MLIVGVAEQFRRVGRLGLPVGRLRRRQQGNGEELLTIECHHALVLAVLFVFRLDGDAGVGPERSIVDQSNPGDFGRRIAGVRAFDRGGVLRRVDILLLVALAETRREENFQVPDGMLLAIS